MIKTKFTLKVKTKVDMKAMMESGLKIEENAKQVSKNLIKDFI